ncbi:amylo-alpha-1,6-glucosidase [Pseudovibrio brasiliensis]|uniref:Glycoside hydrolase family 37 n=1 Tax=Pseudovibrio brasiliensis TaxID=1898042 RepID=A0ABX8AQ07_9HYPH|nr:trehalase family glycosidase [Pseudovibrio brasiliensis]QUS56312.1 glycoside hydrolase family 37 [Pseudovibrio brasiliensis]
MTLFDFTRVPFSRHQRFTTLSMVRGHGGEQQCYLRYVAGGDERPSHGRLCKLEFLSEDGSELTPRFSLSPHRLDVKLFASEQKRGDISFCIGNGEVLHVKGQGASVRFALEGSRYDYAFQHPGGEQCIVAAGENLRLTPFASKGNATVEGNWRRDHADNVALTFSGEQFEGGIILHRRLCPNAAKTSFEDVQAASQQAFAEWHGKQHQNEAEKLATYLLWANTVPAEGALTHPATYMSKNHMINIWSWDNAFSAIGLAGIDPELAFSQFAAIYEWQDESGLLPDFVHDAGASFAFTKPPVHGWAISHILETYRGSFTPEQLVYLREKMERQLSYWLTHTRASPQELPSYFHGNDSGWDNASFFDHGGPVIGPDLPTFLCLTAKCIAQLYRKADAPEIASKFDQISMDLRDLMIKQLWNGRTFEFRKSTQPELPLPDTSLAQFMPLLLGSDLPREIAEKLLERFNSLGFLTEWGPATEHPQSTYYEADGYWRGPIWAPTTLLIFDGLCQQGEIRLAHELAKRFMRTCEASGMAENFDALTGDGLRDKAFAWTSAVYLRFQDVLSKAQLTPA